MKAVMSLLKVTTGRDREHAENGDIHGCSPSLLVWGESFGSGGCCLRRVDVTFVIFGENLSEFRRL